MNSYRSELTEERTINHHGEPRQVPTEMTEVETVQIPRSFNKVYQVIKNYYDITAVHIILYDLTSVLIILDILTHIFLS